MTRGQNQGRKGRGRPGEKVLDGLPKWYGRDTATELVSNMEETVIWLSTPLGMAHDDDDTEVKVKYAGLA